MCVAVDSSRSCAPSEDSPDSIRPVEAPRNMHTGQYSTAPENSLPQTRQTRLSTAFMDPTTPQIGHELPKWSWCESSPRPPLVDQVAFHEEVGLFPTIATESLFTNEISSAVEPDRVAKGEILRLRLLLRNRTSLQWSFRGSVKRQRARKGQFRSSAVTSMKTL